MKCFNYIQAKKVKNNKRYDLLSKCIFDISDITCDECSEEQNPILKNNKPNT